MTRPGNRQPDELRPVTFTLYYTDYAEGSVLISMGRTRVLCNATVSEQVPGWLVGLERGWVTAEYALLPRSTHTRTPRETRGLGGRTQEIQRLIGRALRMMVDLTLLGERQIIVDCDVIQADGGTRTAAITGGSVALQLALRRLIAAGAVEESALTGGVAAVSVGVVEGTPMLDLCYDEDFIADVDMNVVMTGDGQLVEVQGTAERQPFSRGTLDTLVDLASKGIAQLCRLQENALAGATSAPQGDGDD